MTDSDLSFVIDRISAGTHTDTDITLLRELLSQGDRQSVLQLGKYNINIGRAEGIHIGDRIYQTLDDEAVQATVAAIQQTDRARTTLSTPAELTLRKERKQTRYFTEPLADDLGLDMILVTGGEFEMGSPEDEPERSSSESPQHLVTVPTFCMGRYPVTQAQWRFVATLPLLEQDLDPDPSGFKGDTRPVERVSWYDAVEFCARLSTDTKRSYRLSSEAEWEYACRAGKKTPFYFGKILTVEVANHNGNYTYNNSPKGEYREETTPVDQFGIANAWGLFDMHGNIWEWCQDHWHDNYEGAPTDGSAWLSENENQSRVARGGSWDYSPRHCRSAYRGDSFPREANNDVGFRVVCDAPRTL